MERAVKLATRPSEQACKALIALLASWLISRSEILTVHARKLASLGLMMFVGLLSRLQLRHGRPRRLGGAVSGVAIDLSGSSAPSHILLVGDADVGKTTLAHALIHARDQEHTRVIEPCHEASPVVVVVVWTASILENLKSYASRWRAAARAGRRAPPIIIVCNKTDAEPCPMPQMDGLIAALQIPCLAVSATKGTNLGALWQLIDEHVGAPDAKLIDEQVPDTTGPTSGGEWVLVAEPELEAEAPPCGGSDASFSSGRSTPPTWRAPAEGCDGGSPVSIMTEGGGEGQPSLSRFSKLPPASATALDALGDAGVAHD